MVKLVQIQGGSQLREDVDGMATILSGLADRVATLERTAVTVEEPSQESEESDSGE